MTEADALRTEFGLTYREGGRTASRRTIIALHGAGADETTMLPLAAAIDPGARLLSLRGRVDQEGERRWFRKKTPVRFDQRSIRAQAKAFAMFLDSLHTAGRIDLARSTFLGYSNGGNLVHATMLLRPGRIRQAVLLRCMPVLDRPPRADLSDSSVLVIAGARDLTYGPFAASLVGLLRDNRAAVASHAVDAGHELGEADISCARLWLAASGLV